MTNAVQGDPTAKLADAVKQLITLASAALTLSVLFFKDVANGHVSQAVRWDMRISWALMLVSICAGMVALFMLVNLQSVANTALKWASGIQEAAFALSFIGLAGAAWVSLK